MKAAELFVKCLEAEGVTHIFGVPGEENLAFLEALRTSFIKLVVTRHEQGAVFMAATFGRLTGKIGVALSTLGPGATNLVTGVAYAQLGAMPLLVITGQKPIRKSKQGRFQIVDVAKMMSPLTKLSTTLVSGARVASTVREAVKLAESERPGAVHIEFPEDVAEEEVDDMPIMPQKIRRGGPDPKAITQAVEALLQAKRPVIVVGSGANRKLVRKHLHAFVEKTRIPFVTTQMGKGVEDERSEMYLGTTALSAGDFVHAALETADVLVMIGHDVVEKPPIILRSGDKTIIHIHFYEAVVDAVYAPTLEVVGDISHTLWALTEQLTAQASWETDALRAYKHAQSQYMSEATTINAFPLYPERVVADLRQALPDDGILSLDNGMYKLFVARNYPAAEQNTVLLDNALATMGAGLPAGMAAKLLFPTRPVVVLTGDGGFMMSVAELETAKRLGLHLVVIVLNDHGYGMIKWKQRDMGFDAFGLDFENPDFVKLANSFGATGHSVLAAETFLPIVRQALAGDGIHIIDCPIDYSRNSELFGEGLRNAVKDHLNSTN